MSDHQLADYLLTSNPPIQVCICGKRWPCPEVVNTPATPTTVKLDEFVMIPARQWFTMKANIDDLENTNQRLRSYVLQADQMVKEATEAGVYGGLIRELRAYLVDRGDGAWWRWVIDNRSGDAIRDDLLAIIDKHDRQVAHPGASNPPEDPGTVCRCGHPESPGYHSPLHCQPEST